MNIKPQDGQTQLSSGSHGCVGSIAGKLLIASLGIAILSLLAWWLTGKKVPATTAPGPLQVTSEAMAWRIMKQNAEEEVLARSRIRSGTPPTTVLATAPLTQSSWPNQTAWKRSLLESNAHDWQNEVGLKLTAEFKPELLGFFRAQTNINIRAALAWPLARVGGEDVFEVLTAALTNDYRTAKLGLDDAVELSVILRAMHPMTTNTPAALQFARQAIEFEFWMTHQPFAAVAGDDGTLARELRAFYVKAAISVLAACRTYAHVLN